MTNGSCNFSNHLYCNHKSSKKYTLISWGMLLNISINQSIYYCGNYLKFGTIFLTLEATDNHLIFVLADLALSPYFVWLISDYQWHTLEYSMITIL